MTPQQEQAVTEALAEGLSERETAKRVGVSPTAVHRVRERIGAAAGATDSGSQEAAGTAVTPGAQEAGEARTEPPAGDGLGGLQAERDRLAGIVATYEGRADASRAALGELEAERLEVLAAGKDAAPLRPRMVDAAADLRDSEDAARINREHLAAIDAQIVAVTARRDLRAMRGELAAAVAERDAVCGRSGDRQRRAVTAVWEAALDFTAVAADEDAATRRVAELAAAVDAHAAALGEAGSDVPPAESTALWVSGDVMAGGPLALWKAIDAARRGEVGAVAVQLGEAGGWLPPSAEDLAAEQARHAERLAAMTAQQTAPEPSQPWTNPDPHSVPIDAEGRPLPWTRPPHPGDAYPGTPVSYPGSLGFAPWPR